MNKPHLVAAAADSVDKSEFVGVDDGHYAIKVVTEDGKMYSVPSRGQAGRHAISWNQGNDDEGFYQTEEGQTYTAHEHLAGYEDTRFKGYPKSQLNRVLIHHALLAAGFGGKSVVIATGLPVSYYYLPDGRRDEALISAKRDNLQRRVSCGSRPVADVKRNLVTTEAIAAYYDQLMDIQGRPSKDFKEMQSATVGVIDVGGKTTDSAVVYPGGQQVDPERSGSSDTGVLQLNDAIEARLRVMFDLDHVPPRMVESAIIQGTIRLAGEEKNVRDAVIVEKERLAEQIMAGIRTRIGTGRDLDYVLFVGGGSIVLRDQLIKHYPHARIPDHPEYANARGMLKIAKYVFGDQ